MSEITPFENNRQALNEFYRGTTLYRIPEKQPGSGIALDGECRRGIIIVLPQSHASYPETTREMLGKMLAAQGLAIEDTAFAVWSANEPWQAVELIKSRQPKALLFYGVDPIKLGLSLSPYDFYHEGNIKMLYADGLDRIAGDNALKTKLWNVLKQHFLYK